MCFIDGKQGRSDVHGSVAQQWEEPGRVEEKLLGQPARSQGWSLSGGCKVGGQGGTFHNNKNKCSVFNKRTTKVFHLLFLTVS